MTWYAVGTIGAAAIGSLSGSSAKKGKQKAKKRAMLHEQKLYDQRIENTERYRKGGNIAQDQLNAMMQTGDFSRRFSMDDFEKDPGYDFRLQEGEKSLERGAAARGGLLSGAAMKAMERYGQDYGSQEYGKARSRFNEDRATRYNKLMGQVNTGLQGTAMLNKASGQFGARGSQLLQQRGADSADATMNTGNMLMQGIGMLANNRSSGRNSGGWTDKSGTNWWDSSGAATDPRQWE